MALPVGAQSQESDNPLELYDDNDDGVIDADELIAAAVDHINGHIDRDLLTRVYNLYSAGDSSAVTWQSEDSLPCVCALHDSNKDGVVQRDEVIVVIKDYLFNDKISRDVLIEVIKCFLFGPDSPQIPSPTSGPCTISKPTGLKVTSRSQRTVSLTWNAVTDAIEYKVEWGSSSATTSSTSSTAFGLRCGRTYQFQVRARGDGYPYSKDYGDASPVVSGTTSDCQSAPAPSDLEISAVDDTSVSLIWTAVTGAIEYKVEWGSLSTTTSFASYTVSNLKCETTYQFRVRARGDGYPYSKDYGVPSPIVSGTTSDCPPPAPTGLTSTAHSTGKIVLNWNDVPGGSVTYEVQQWDRVFGLFYEWKTLPFDAFEVEFTGSKALISGLDYDHTYDHRVRAKQGDGYSEWTDRFKTKVPLPHVGHQADHTVKYSIGVIPTPVPGAQTSSDPGVVIPAAIPPAVAAWNKAVDSHPTHMLFCKGEDCRSSKDDENTDRNIDKRTVIIKVAAGMNTSGYKDGQSDCGAALACVKSRDGADLDYADDGGHMNNLEMVVEQPALQPYDFRGLIYQQRYVWTNNRSLHGEPAEGGGKYYYLPSVMMHEFGHTAGLGELSNFGRYSGYIMYYPEKQTEIPNKDRDFLRDVYRNHTPHAIPND